MRERFRRPVSVRIPHDHWEWRFKFAGLVATGISTLSLIFGGAAGIWTYHQKSVQDTEIKKEELRLWKYNQLKEVYSQLVDAATEVGTASSKEKALEKLAEFDRLYFGRAHIYVIDKEVVRAKIQFYWNAHDLVETETLPSRAISDWALKCLDSCDHVPIRSLPLFKARQLLRTLFDTDDLPLSHDSIPA